MCPKQRCGARPSFSFPARFRTREKMRATPECFPRVAKDRAPQAHGRGAEQLAPVIRSRGASPASGHGRPRAVPCFFSEFPFPRVSASDSDSDSEFLSERILRGSLMRAVSGVSFPISDRRSAERLANCRSEIPTNSDSFPCRSRPRRAGDPSASIAYNVWSSRSCEQSEQFARVPVRSAPPYFPSRRASARGKK
jgi:hypothetical protein